MSERKTPETPTVGGSCPTCGTFCVVLADESVPGKATYQPVRPAVWPEPGAPAPAEKPPLDAPTPKQREEEVDMLAVLERVHAFIHNGIEFGYIAVPEDDDPGAEVLPMVETALSRLRTHSPGEPVGWRPIQTAPKDGTSVLIFGGTYNYDADGYDGEYPLERAVIASWRDFDRAWKRSGYGSEYDGVYWHEPTHWMPLPEPPIGQPLDTEEPADG